MDISIIVPVYNEEKRMCNFLPALIKYSSSNLKNFELIFVNDGSKDNSLEVLKKYKADHKFITIITYEKNRGKGYAVRKGIMAANGEKIIFIDCDGSIMPDQLPPMIKELDNYDCVVGNRRDKMSNVIMNKYRRLTQYLFNLVTMILLNSKINDNLCGFKGFRKKVAKDLFRKLFDYGWVFDVEIFYKIKMRGYTLKRIPLTWKWVGDSRIKFTDPFWMFLKLIILLKLRMSKFFYKNDKNR